MAYLTGVCPQLPGCQLLQRMLYRHCPNQSVEKPGVLDGSLRRILLRQFAANAG